MSTPELSGLWTYRSFNPTYVTGDPREDELILADGDLNLEHRTSPTTLEGTIEWRTGPRPEEKDGLDLKGTVLEGDIRGLEIVGTGRPGTNSGWEYRYHGHLLPSGHGLVAIKTVLVLLNTAMAKKYERTSVDDLKKVLSEK